MVMELSSWIVKVFLPLTIAVKSSYQRSLKKGPKNTSDGTYLIVWYVLGDSGSYQVDYLSTYLLFPYSE